MNFDDLDALLWLARSGSLQGAALASGVPRTTLRRRVDRLRDAVGETLVEFGAQGLTLTRAGELLVRRAPRLLSQQRSLLDEARRVAREPVGKLRVVVATGFPPAFIAQVHAEICALAPDLRVDLRIDPRPLERLDEGFDIVVHWGEPPAPRDGYSRVVWRAPARLLAAPAYLDRRGTPRSVAQLEAHDLLGSTIASDRWPLLDGGAVPICPIHTVDDLYVLGCMAGAGLGIALIPLGGVSTEPSIEALVPVLPELVGGEMIVRVFLPTPTSEGSAPHAVVQRLRALWEDANLPDA